MQALMSLPQSNASSERVFSMLAKVYTSERSNMAQKGLTSILTVKTNNYGCCHDTKFSNKLYGDTKKADHQHR